MYVCILYIDRALAAINTDTSECWCSVLGDLIIPADSLSTSLGIGLSITFKAGEFMLRWLWGAVAQWSEHLQLKQEALGSIPGGYPGFFSLPAGLQM